MSSTIRSTVSSPRHEPSLVITTSFLRLSSCRSEFITFSKRAGVPSRALHLPVLDVHLADEEEDYSDKRNNEDGNYGCDGSAGHAF